MQQDMNKIINTERFGNRESEVAAADGCQQEEVKVTNGFISTPVIPVMIDISTVSHLI